MCIRLFLCPSTSKHTLSPVAAVVEVAPRVEVQHAALCARHHLLAALDAAAAQQLVVVVVLTAGASLAAGRQGERAGARSLVFVWRRGRVDIRMRRD